MEFKEGKKYLLQSTHSYPRYQFEAKILEVSPSQKRIKLQYLDSAIQWVDISDYDIIEELA